MSLAGVRLKDFWRGCLWETNDKGLIFVRKRNETWIIIEKYNEIFHNFKKKRKFKINV